VVQARPDILAPPKVLRAVLLAYVQTLPDWIHMAKLFEDYLRQEKLTSDLAAHAVRSFAAALRYEEAIKVYEQIESGALTPRFSKPHFEAMFFRNVVDAYGGLKRFDDVQRIVDHCAAKLPKESLSTLIVGAMNALVDNDRAEDAMKLFNRAHQEYKIPVDNQLSNAMRRAKHPILQQRLEQTSNDESLFGRFLTRTSSPEETISDAWKAYEESQQAGTKLGFSAHLVLMQLLHAVPKHALSGERAARIYAEAVGNSSELVNDSTSLTSAFRASPFHSHLSLY
jgi:tetratricopeptide (TPR) repeat protein